MRTSFGDTQLDVTILTSLREMAKEGKHASEIAALLLEKLGGPHVLLGMMYFMGAFCLPLGDAKALGAYHRFPELLNDALDPLIHDPQAKWHTDG